MKASSTEATYLIGFAVGNYRMGEGGYLLHIPTCMAFLGAVDLPNV